MIVGPYFDGDHGALSWAQHERYYEALCVIWNGCEHHLDAAALMLGVSRPGDDLLCGDHRTLQLSHDLLAAAWRFRFDPSQPDLLATDQPTMNHWLTWLSDEVENWWRDPHLIRDVRISAERLNTTAGYFAEARVAKRLLELYQEVPWLDDWRQAIERDYQRQVMPQSAS